MPKPDFLRFLRRYGMEPRFNRFLRDPANLGFNQGRVPLCRYFFNRRRLVGICFWIYPEPGDDRRIEAETSLGLF